MGEKKTWKEFQQSGLLWWINMILHTFGWAIVTNGTEAYPARVKFRGFKEEHNTEGYQAVSKYLLDHMDEIHKESLE